MNPEAPTSTLGRLKSLGIEHDWQVAYLLPKKHEDLSLGTPEFGALNSDGSSLLIAMVASEPRFNHGPPPRLNVELMCKGKQQVSAVVWGATQEVQAQLAPRSIVYLKGQPGEYNGQPQFRIDEVISPEWAGRLRPVYPGKQGVIKSALVTERVLARLDDAIPVAAQDLRQRLASIAPEPEMLNQVDAPAQSYEHLLRMAHLPDTAANAEAALAAVERLAAIDMLMRARDESGGRMRREPIRLMSSSLQARESALPYPLTDEQKQAVEEITTDLRRPETMRRLLSGDVGTGKTAVYGTAAAAAYDAGARVAIMLPNVNLATQVFNEIREYWPDIPALLVSGDLDKKTDLNPVPFLVGTTALLHRDIGERDLVISDEQQKFSVEQREQMAGMDGHLLEVSATCIPRSQALLKFGVVDLSVLSKGHVEKEIHTKIRRSEDRVDLFADAMKTVNDGHQLAVVYPLKENSESDDGDQDRRSAVKMVKSWEKHFPGRVRLLHGQMTDDEKQAVIADMKADRADILVSTTVIEVGLTLPRLRRLLVVSAERHGLTGLHQLRGRLARHGGTGYFDLYLPNEDVNPDTLERLSILEQTTNGFAVAEHDLFMRGYGNLAGKKQSGTDSGFLCAHPIEASRLSEVIELVPDMTDQRPDPVPMDSVKQPEIAADEAEQPDIRKDSDDDSYLLDARGNHKWFASKDKAEQFLARKGISTHEVVEENNRFYMRQRNNDVANTHASEEGTTREQSADLSAPDVTGLPVNDRLALMQAEANTLKDQVDKAYEAGDKEQAEHLDSQLDSLYDQIEAILVERQEDGLTAPNSPAEQVFSESYGKSHGEIGDMEPSADGMIIKAYVELYVRPEGVMAEMDDEERATMLRSAFDDAGDYMGGFKGDVITDDQLIDAARDLYESREALLKRRQSPKASFGRDPVSVLSGSHTPPSGAGPSASAVATAEHPAQHSSSKADPSAVAESAFDDFSEDAESMFAPARSLDQMTYRTQSGRITSPGIKLDFSTAEALKSTRAALRDWLVCEARAEAQSQGDAEMLAKLDGCSSSTWTVEQGDMINLYLFNDITGDLTKHQVTNTVQADAQDDAIDFTMELDAPAHSTPGHQMSLV